jgi:hypothetical protein
MLLALVVVFKGNDRVVVHAMVSHAFACMELHVLDDKERNNNEDLFFIQEIFLFLTFIYMSTDSINIIKSYKFVEFRFKF